MQNSEQRSDGFVFTGWHMLAVMVLFFGTIISVNLVMAWNAISSWSGLVVQNTYVASQQFNAKVAEANALAASGKRGELIIWGETVTYRLFDGTGRPLAADSVTAIFKRPVDEREDFSLDLSVRDPGVFEAARRLAPGQWIADIVSMKDGRKVFHQTVRTVVAGASDELLRPGD
ncbi:FixH family protein [Sinorhizobium sp. BG8]|uniref:FixH family protein n=1 Tax=Sinorhizobium sp. BG8 TaxID=2613773 RepID=UPI00193DB812|nr:FixH family protein [Sinorhizobium sp. BG8]QRM55766.1 cation transporter [Sinorhizobium sp. BG8]